MAEDVKDGQAAAVVVPRRGDDATAKAAADKATADARQPRGDRRPATRRRRMRRRRRRSAPEQKAADTKPRRREGRERQGGTDAAAKNKAPDKYDIKIPDGAKDWLDESDLKDLEGKARAKGFTNEQLQTLVNARADELAEQSAAFRAQTEADPIVGGDKLPETQRLSKIAMDRLHPEGTPDGKAFRAFLTKTGYGNHVQVVKRSLGKLMAEDGHVASGGAKPARTQLRRFRRNADDVAIDRPDTESIT